MSSRDDRDRCRSLSFCSTFAHNLPFVLSLRDPTTRVVLQVFVVDWLAQQEKLSSTDAQLHKMTVTAIGTVFEIQAGAELADSNWNWSAIRQTVAAVKAANGDKAKADAAFKSTSPWACFFFCAICNLCDPLTAALPCTLLSFLQSSWAPKSPTPTVRTKWKSCRTTVRTARCGGQPLLAAPSPCLLL